MTAKANLSWLGVALISMGLAGASAIGQTITPQPHAPVCAEPAPGTVACTARVVVDHSNRPLVLPKSVLPKSRVIGGTLGAAPYGPAQLLAAYRLTGVAPFGPIIAIVDAYDAPNISADLAAYNKNFGLPPFPDCAVPIASAPKPCFQKVDQRGGTAYPPHDPSWALEIALDVEIAHAICQNCSIMLVESDTSNYPDMMAAVDLAATSGAVALSGSWGSFEFADEVTLDSHFNHRGVAMVFSSGDFGYMMSYPAASPYVTAAGGTSLTSQGETAWGLGGSGCSAFERKADWQIDRSGCLGHRTIADVAAVADPITGAAIYSSDYQSPPAWYQVGGTSLSAPIIAGVYALSGRLLSGTLPPTAWANQLPYLDPSQLYDVTSGGNGGRFTCGKKGTDTYYLCHAMAGYDGPTGLGTPNGTGGF